MSSKEAFGRNLRRARLKSGLTLEAIARQTRVGIEYFEALEENDFTDWPHGIYARAWIKAYAEAVGLDARTTVNDFCRWFPNGDRRGDRLLRETAQIIGHDLDLLDDLAGSADDRRTSGQPEEPQRGMMSRLLARLVPSRRVAANQQPEAVSKPM